MTNPTVPWNVTEQSRNVHTITFSDVASGWTRDVFLNSDAHWDNPHCVRSLLRKHLEEAKAKNAPIIIYGDLLCVMQGKFDKRGNKGSIRPEDVKQNYFRHLVKSLALWLQPYAPWIAVIGPGNHESAALKHHEVDLIAELVEELHRLCPGIQTRQGGFSGWVRFRFCAASGNWMDSVRMWYHHGYGGGGPVTRGVIQSNRKAVYVDADVIVSGHTHDAWQVPIQRISLSNSNRIVHSRQIHISTPGYKEEYDDGAEGFHNELGRPPKPLGGHWLSFSVSAPNGLHLSTSDHRAEGDSYRSLDPVKWDNEGTLMPDAEAV